MTLSRVLRFGSVLAVSALGAGVAFAQPPAHTTVTSRGPGYNTGPRVVLGVGINTGYGFYAPGYNSFSEYGVPYNDGPGYLGYGYPSGFRGSNYGSRGALVPSYQALPAQPVTAAPLPTGDPAVAVLTVVAAEGAKVSFDGTESAQTGSRHSFTTKVLTPGVPTSVSVKVDGPGGPSSLSINLRAGDKATIDLRK